MNVKQIDKTIINTTKQIKGFLKNTKCSNKKIVARSLPNCISTPEEAIAVTWDCNKDNVKQAIEKAPRWIKDILHPRAGRVRRLTHR